jgi:hypothetical protein
VIIVSDTGPLNYPILIKQIDVLALDVVVASALALFLPLLFFLSFQAKPRNLLLAHEARAVLQPLKENY